MFQLVDHSDRIVLYGNVTMAARVDEQLITPQSEFAGSRAGLEIADGDR